MVLATSRMPERRLTRWGERITSLGTFALKATPWVTKVTSSRSGYSERALAKNVVSKRVWMGWLKSRGGITSPATWLRRSQTVALPWWRAPAGRDDTGMIRGVLRVRRASGPRRAHSWRKENCWASHEVKAAHPVRPRMSLSWRGSKPGAGAGLVGYTKGGVAGGV